MRMHVCNFLKKIKNKRLRDQVVSSRLHDWHVSSHTRFIQGRSYNVITTPTSILFSACTVRFSSEALLLCERYKNPIYKAGE